MTRPFWVVAELRGRGGGTCDFAENSVIKSDFSVYESSPCVKAKPGVTLQPCCAHVTRSSISGTRMQNGRQMFSVLFSVWGVSVLSSVALAKFSVHGWWCTETVSTDENRVLIYYTAVAIVAIPNVILPFVCSRCSVRLVHFDLKELIFVVAHTTRDQTIPYTFQLMGRQGKRNSRWNSEVQQ